MDKFDRAQELDARFLAQALEMQAGKATKGISQTICIDCKSPIPTARQNASPGCTRCIACQQKFETGR